MVYVDKIVDKEVETIKQVPISVEKLVPRDKVTHVCYSVLQCVAVCCSVLQCDAVCCSAHYGGKLVPCDKVTHIVCRSVLQCVAVCCSALQCVAV